jgi:hypothetical protein
MILLAGRKPTKVLWILVRSGYVSRSNHMTSFISRLPNHIKLNHLFNRLPNHIKLNRLKHLYSIIFGYNEGGCREARRVVFIVAP